MNMYSKKTPKKPVPKKPAVKPNLTKVVHPPRVIELVTTGPMVDKPDGRHVIKVEKIPNQPDFIKLTCSVFADKREFALEEVTVVVDANVLAEMFWEMFATTSTMMPE